MNCTVCAKECLHWCVFEAMIMFPTLPVVLLQTSRSLCISRPPLLWSGICIEWAMNARERQTQQSLSETTAPPAVVHVNYLQFWAMLPQIYNKCGENMTCTQKIILSKQLIIDQYRLSVPRLAGLALWESDQSCISSEHVLTGVISERGNSGEQSIDKLA